jgi:hypothetical protein
LLHVLIMKPWADPMPCDYIGGNVKSQGEFGRYMDGIC